MHMCIGHNAHVHRTALQSNSMQTPPKSKIPQICLLVRPWQCIMYPHHKTAKTLTVYSVMTFKKRNYDCKSLGTIFNWTNKYLKMTWWIFWKIKNKRKRNVDQWAFDFKHKMQAVINSYMLFNNNYELHWPLCHV